MLLRNVDNHLPDYTVSTQKSKVNILILSLRISFTALSAVVNRRIIAVMSPSVCCGLRMSFCGSSMLSFSSVAAMKVRHLNVYVTSFLAGTNDSAQILHETRKWRNRQLVSVVESLY